MCMYINIDKEEHVDVYLYKSTPLPIPLYRFIYLHVYKISINNSMCNLIFTHINLYLSP